VVTKKKFLYFALIHVFFLIVVSLASTIGSYEKSSAFVKNKFTNALLDTKVTLSRSFGTPGLQQYLSVSGIEAGYGFFAPNVASSYILKTTIYRRDNNAKVKEYFFPPFKTREGKNRYHTLLGSFQDRLKILENDQKKKKSDLFKESNQFGEYLDIYIKSIGRFYYKEYDPDKYLVRCTLYLYDHPSLKQALSGNQEPVLVKLLELDANKLNIAKK
jgi:hypothetical protein